MINNNVSFNRTLFMAQYVNYFKKYTVVELKWRVILY